MSITENIQLRIRVEIVRLSEFQFIPKISLFWFLLTSKRDQGSTEETLAAGSQAGRRKGKLKDQ